MVVASRNHYRWYYEGRVRVFASGHLAREVMDGHPMPLLFGAYYRAGDNDERYTVGDGIGHGAVAGLKRMLRRFSRRSSGFSRLDRSYWATIPRSPTLVSPVHSSIPRRLGPSLQILRHTAPRTSSG